MEATGIQSTHRSCMARILQKAIQARAIVSQHGWLHRHTEKTYCMQTLGHAVSQSMSRAVHGTGQKSSVIDRQIKDYQKVSESSQSNGWDDSSIHQCM